MANFCKPESRCGSWDQGAGVAAKCLQRLRIAISGRSRRSNFTFGLRRFTAQALAPFKAIVLPYVLPRGVSHVEREAGPPIPTRRDWRTPHPQRPRATGVVGGGADLSHKPGEPEVDWETSTDAELKVPP